MITVRRFGSAIGLANGQTLQGISAEVLEAAGHELKPHWIRDAWGST
jgi:hypothetical protein